MHALIFDLDGVLIDSDAVHRRTLKEAAARFGFSIPDVGTKTTREKLKAAEVPDERVDEIYAVKRALYNEYMSDSVTGDPALYSLFMRLSKVGYPLAVCSNSHIDSVRLVVTRLGIAPFLNVLTSASEVVRGKPDPLIYTLTLRRLKADPKRVVAFEDSDDGIAAAKGAEVGKVIRCTTETVVKEASKWL